MAYEVVWHERIQDDLGPLPKRDATRIIAKVREHLAVDPIGSARPLKGRFKGLYRFRVGRFRVFFVIDHAARLVRVLRVEGRKDAYR